MTYRQLQAELKALKANGHSVPKLNSKKEVLQAAYDEITGYRPSVLPTAGNQWWQAGYAAAAAAYDENYGELGALELDQLRVLAVNEFDVAPAKARRMGKKSIIRLFEAA